MPANEPIECFDFDGNGFIGFGDVRALFWEWGTKREARKCIFFFKESEMSVDAVAWDFLPPGSLIPGIDR
ncbi:MAG: hypothetical protein APR53_00245 [Methanoculleus sp. SDB]|nr:MAG: hypothetical protein APR53_00245 [Methanoculleus sp. SDB]